MAHVRKSPDAGKSLEVATGVEPVMEVRIRDSEIAK